MPGAAERAIRVIEPNLAGHSGHYAEFVRAVAQRSQGVFSAIDVWGPRNAAAVLAGIPRVRVSPHDVHNHKAESAAIRNALQCGDPFLVLTARAQHAPLLSWLARSAPPGSMRQARLYFHWREQSPMQRALMALAPRARRDALCIAPTEATAAFLRGQGWQRVACVPYPVLAPSQAAQPRPFTHLLVAGAARVNKGIELIAQLAERMAARGDATRLVVQTTAKRVSGRRGAREEVALQRLRASGARGLELHDAAPDSAEYGARFAGALVLAPYDPVHFADNVSGVVLDGLLRGAPVVASAGSWPGQAVERFAAGATFAARGAVGSAAVDAFDAAIQRVRSDWDGACARACTAAEALAREHDPAALVRVLSEGI